MNRRQFLHVTGNAAAVLGTVSIPGVSRAAMDCYVKRLPGAQLFTIRNALSADVDAALGKLAAAGIREVELYDLSAKPQVFGLACEDFKALLDKHGLQMTFGHFSGDTFDVPAIANNAKTLGIDTVVLAAAPGLIQVNNGEVRAQGLRTREDMDRLADLLNMLGRKFRTEGLLFAYHNHHVEFLPAGEDIPYNYLMWNTDPQFVRSELDIGWAALAGIDYLDVLYRFGNRTVSCHLKDFNGKRPRDMGDFRAAAAHLLPPGAGTVKFTRVLELMDYYSIRHGFIEIDVSDNPVADIARGREHLAGLRDCG